MEFVAFLIIATGAYLLDSAARNRPPIGTLQELLRDPSDLAGTITKLNGTWVKVRGSSPAAPSGPGKAVSDAKPKGDNGKLPDSALVSLSWAPGQRLAPAAATALEQLNQAYRVAFNRNMAVTDTYRTYARQVALKAARGNLAATPGTSNHGWGLAVDLGGGVQDFGTSQYNWMLANAPRFGWVAPDWARQNGSKPEAWHWEFTG